MNNFITGFMNVINSTEFGMMVACATVVTSPIIIIYTFFELMHSIKRFKDMLIKIKKEVRDERQ